MIRVAAGLVVQNHRILIGRRKADQKMAGFWEFPGGKIENQESPESCLVREFEEELGMKVEVLKPFGSHTHHYPQGEIELMAYWCRALTGYSKFECHDKVEWVRPEDFHHFIFAPADVPFLNQIIQQGLPAV